MYSSDYLESNLRLLPTFFSFGLVHHTSRKNIEQIWPKPCNLNRFMIHSVAILLYNSLWTYLALNCGFLLNSYNSLWQIIKVKLDVSTFKQLYLLWLLWFYFSFLSLLNPHLLEYGQVNSHSKASSWEITLLIRTK